MKLKLAVGAIFAIAITVFARMGDRRVLSRVPHGCEARGSYLIPIPLLPIPDFRRVSQVALGRRHANSMLSCPTQE